jgi:formylglycine-generating enzyme required for sulfatase activity/tRNA A-37 threonylcarbamoyl transferase component Bud32
MPSDPPAPTSDSAVECPRCRLRFAPDAGPDTPARLDADNRGTIDVPPPMPHPPTPTPALPASDLPARIGRFEVRRFLGEGVFGRVYEAFDPALKRAVALKVAKPEQLASQERTERFQREARAAAGLLHPHIVAVFDSGRDGPHHYIASAFIDGKPLDSVLLGLPDGQTLPLREAVQIVRHLAEALAYAHKQGVIHRDVKPANVMLRTDGEPLLMDFGLAARSDEAEKLTQDGAMLGTAAYMAPEQWHGRAEAVSDQYSLGCLLFELLTGRLPFRGGSTEHYMLLHLKEAPPSPRSLRPGVPRDLETICLKCLEKEPGQRYPDCQALADDLRRFLDGEPVTARRPGPGERLVKWARRSPAVAGLTAAVLLVTVLGMAGIVWKYLDAEQQKGIAQGKEMEAQREAARATKARDFLVSIFELSDANGRRGTMTARQILDDAEKRIPQEFAEQAELQAELQAAVETVYAKMTANAPLAMILEVRGTVQLQSSRDLKQRAVPQTLLYSGDRLSLAADTHVQVVVLSDLHKERLKAPGEVTIGRKGCQPADAIKERTGDAMMTFVRLSKGSFYMGGGGGALGVKTEIKEDFEIAVHDVTQGQWQAVMGDNPSYFSRFGGGRNEVKNISDEELKLFPVESVSWNDAQEFIKKLNENNCGSGYVYRLPTGAEWEYACRGGATSEEECSYHFYFDKPTNVLSSEQANFNGSEPFAEGTKGKYLGRPTRVGAYPPNKLGLCDMHGNVWQWCEDLYEPKEGSGRVIRGGCWSFDGSHCRAAHRYWDAPTLRILTDGLRLARVPVR